MVGVRLQKVTKLFGQIKAVDEASLEIRRGELFFLLGPSGCGKTTLLRLIAGFYRPNAGRIFFDDRDITSVPPHKRNTGMVFQNYALWPHMTVWKNVEYGLDMRKLSPGEKRRRVREVLEIVHMDKYADRRPNELSGGQQQRVALARALVIQPDVVLLDEPLSNLDAKLRTQMREEIKQIHQKIGTTMIYVTHDQKEALSMAQRMAVLDAGRVVQVGDPQTVYNRPNSVFVAGFIGETNFLKGTITVVNQDVAVDTPMGKVVSKVAYEGAKVGDPVLCSVRPEAIRLFKEKPPRENILRARIENIVYLGDNEQYLLQLKDGSIFKAVEYNPGLHQMRIRDEVYVVFAPEDVVLLRQPARPVSEKA